MMRSFRIIALCICTVLTLAGTARADVDIVGGLTRQMTMLPGDKVEGKLLLRNNADRPDHVKIYQTDYSFSADGKDMYPDPGKAERSNASWITFTPRDINIAPRETISVYYTVQMPSDSKLSGTYWSMLMVEPLPDDSMLANSKNAGIHVGIRMVTRYAVHMVTNIGDSGARDVRFSNGRIVDGTDKRTAFFDVENTGERWLNPQLWAEVFDESGVSLGRFEGDKMRLYPGCSGRFRLDLSRLPKGNFSALVVADNGDEHVFGSQYKFQLK